MKRRISILIMLMLASPGAIFAQDATAPQDTSPQAPAAAEPLHVSRLVMEDQRIASPMPEYPPDAKADGIEGTVVLRALISKTGTVDRTEVVSGPERIRSAANEAVSSWTYKPYTIDDKPVPVQTTIMLNFKASDASVTTGTPVEAAPAEAASVAAAATAQPARTKVPAGIMAGRLLRKITPDYPEVAIANHVTGVVVLRGIISKSGDTSDLSVISGPGALQLSALNAVRRWKYKPYLLNGEPTDVDTTITVNFNESRPANIQHGPQQPHPLGKPY